MKPLANKVILITGTSSGIGRAAAIAFSKEGAKVVAVSRNREKLQSLEQELKGDGHLIFVADVTQEPMMKMLLSQVEEKYGCLDLLICNAGVGYHTAVEQMKLETLRKVFETNFFSIVRMTQLALPLLKKSHAQVMLVSSVIGRASIPNYSAYCASKFALEAFGEALRCEVKKEGIAVTMVCPPRVKTDFSENTYREQESQMTWTRMKSADQMAQKLVQVAKKPKRDLVYTLGAKFLLFFHHYFPKMYDAILQRTLCRN